MPETQKYYNPTVKIDNTSLVDFPGLADPIAKLINAYFKFFEIGLIPSDTMGYILRAFTVSLLSALSEGESSNLLATDEDWGIGDDSAQEDDITDRMVAENWMHGNISDAEVKAYLEEMVNEP